MPDAAELLRAGGTAFSSGAVIHPFNFCPYSPECVEGDFCEPRHCGVIGSSACNRRAEAMMLPALSLLLALIHDVSG
jgi:hypothetical protein